MKGDRQRTEGHGDVQRAAGASSIPEKSKRYRCLADQLDCLLAGETDVTANLANTAAVIYHGLPDLNWVGFYVQRGQTLVLGPFQGKPASVRIEIGKGVCGTAAERRRSLVVADVNAFPGHIACDVASRSELVVPLIRGNDLFGVLDLDSPRPARFDAGDQTGCETLAAVLMRHLSVAASA